MILAWTALDLNALGFYVSVLISSDTDWRRSITISPNTASGPFPEVAENSGLGATAALDVREITMPP